MKKALIIFSVILILTGCGGKKNNPPPDINPVAATLTAPAQNEVCTTGTIISATESTVQFTWDAPTNTNSYELVLENLLTSTKTSQTTAQTQISINLLRNTPFSWYIISKSSNTSATAQSSTWKFYNSGPGVVTYAPFPADITSPTFGESITATNGAIDLTWQGSSVNPGTIANYDVYFGTTNTPPIAYSATTNSYVDNVTVVSGTTYYWRVITRDIQGDTSDTGLYQFTVN
jgi:hypothetical protein